MGTLEIGSRLPSRCFDLDVNTRRQAELIERLNRLRSRLADVNQSLVSANLELLPRLLVDVRARQNSVPLDASGEWDWSMDFRVGPLGSIHDLLSTLVENRVIICFHSYSNDFVGS